MLTLCDATIWTGEKGASPDRLSVRIQENRIVEIVRSSSSAGGRTLDLSGHWVVPGLIHAQVHFGAPFWYPHRNAATHPRSELSPRCIWDYARDFARRRRACLDHGVTSVRSLGDPLPDILKIRGLQARAQLNGPRIWTAGPLLTAPGGDPNPPGFPEDAWWAARTVRAVRDTASARRAVTELRLSGVNLITAVYGGRPAVPQLSAPLLQGIIADAQAVSLPTAVRTSTALDMEEAVDAGAWSIEHGCPREGVDGPRLGGIWETMALRGVYFVPALTVQDGRDRQRWTQRVVREAHAAGVPLVMGTGANQPHARLGASVVDELSLLVASGLTPAEALTAATRTAAECLGAAEEIGTIGVGKLADLVVVKGNPLADPATLARPSLVLQGGRVVAVGGSGLGVRR